MKSLSTGYEINPANGRKRKSCSQNQVRDPQTGRCKKVRSKSKRKTKRKSLATGYEINPANGRKRKSCSQNQVRDPQTGRCKKVRSKSKSSKKKSLKKSASPKKKSLKKSASPKKKSLKKSASPQQMDECTVCYDETNAKVPGCNHPLCPTCFSGMRLSGRTISCPICRNRFNNLNIGGPKKKSVKKSASPKKKSSKKSSSPDNTCPVCYETSITNVPGCNHPLCINCYHGMRAANSFGRLSCPSCRNRFNYII
jgi:hypothetical protein